MKTDISLFTFILLYKMCLCNYHRTVMPFSRYMQSEDGSAEGAGQASACTPGCGAGVAVQYEREAATTAGRAAQGQGARTTAAPTVREISEVRHDIILLLYVMLNT